VSGSQSSSQASSFSGNTLGSSGSSASSQASSFGFQGHGVNGGGSASSSNSNSFSGTHGGGLGYVPPGGHSGSNGQHPGSSFGGYGDILPPEFIRGYHSGRRRNMSNNRRKPNGWFTQTYGFGRNDGVIFPS